MFIALYARQSIDKDNSLSIETQLSLCRALIKESEKSTQVREFFDKGYSGKNTNRPSFQNLMNEVTKGNVKKIIVASTAAVYGSPKYLPVSGHFL